MVRRSGARLMMVLALSALACGKREAAPAKNERAPLTGLGGAATSARTEPLPSGCRVMSKQGSVLAATGEVVDKGMLVTQGRWLVLEPGASLVLKHTQSGRELTLEGPGRFLPCVGGEEELSIGVGTLVTHANSGVRPGASVVVGTPFGSLRYADAEARVVVSEHGLEVPEASGDLALIPILPPAQPVPLTGAAKPPTVALSADRALAACEQAVDDASAKARALLDRAPGAAPQGQLAAAHVRARRQARLTCAAATASALAQGKDAAEIGARLQRLAALRKAWKSVPEL
jgi:hypothetical protein